MYIEHSTENHNFIIESKINPVETKDILWVVSSKYCNICPNYDKKYSCPPHSLTFDVISKPYSHLVVNILKVLTEPYEKIYNTVRMINTVEKSIQRKVFDKTLSRPRQYRHH